MKDLQGNPANQQTLLRLGEVLCLTAFYALLAPFTRSPEAVAHELGKLEAEIPPVGGHG